MTHMQLERLNEEAASRSKRERRKANELKTRIIQRMQLQMTAPLDIGLEQTDASLGGQDDVFDLETAERGIRRKRSVAGIVGGLDDAGSDDSSEEEEDDDDDNISEGDGEAKIEALEAELDGLYDSYKQRLMDKDAKLKAKEAREKDKTRDEWRGIKDKGDDSDDDLSDDEEGGWDRVAQAKEAADHDSSESESEDEDSDDGAVVGKKRKLNGAPAPVAKKTRLITKLDDGKVSRSTQLWFDQDVFKGLDVDNIEDDEDENEDADEEEGEEEEDEEEEEDAASGSDSALEVCWQYMLLSNSLTPLDRRTKASRSFPKTNPRTPRCGMSKASMKMKSCKLTSRVRLCRFLCMAFLINDFRKWSYNC